MLITHYYSASKNYRKNLVLLQTRLQGKCSARIFTSSNVKVFKRNKPGKADIAKAKNIARTLQWRGKIYFLLQQQQHRIRFLVFFICLIVSDLNEQKEPFDPIHSFVHALNQYLLVICSYHWKSGSVEGILLTFTVIE